MNWKKNEHICLLSQMIIIIISEHRETLRAKECVCECVYVHVYTEMNAIHDYDYEELFIIVIFGHLWTVTQGIQKIWIRFLYNFYDNLPFILIQRIQKNVIIHRYLNVQAIQSSSKKKMEKNLPNRDIFIRWISSY